MQRAIKKKPVIYGIVAVLLVSILAVTIYNVGFQFDPIQSVFVKLKTFSNFEELESFITTNMEKANQIESIDNFVPLIGGRRESGTNEDVQSLSPESAAVSDYSSTNIQVAGVDEADVVKTDGEYLYVVAESNIYILKAYPYNQAELISKISLNQTYGAQIYIHQNKLVVLTKQAFFSFIDVTPMPMPIVTINGTFLEGGENNNSTIPEGIEKIIVEELPILPYFYSNEIFLKVYDITNKSNPVLSRTVILNGTLSGSRMIGNYVYIVANQPATQPSADNENVTEVILPKIRGTHTREVQPNEIQYIDVPDRFYYFTTIVAVDVLNDAAEPTCESFLTSQTTSMYVSLDNMYLVAPNNNWFLLEDGSESREETLIYRAKLDQEKIVVEAEGSVSGFVLNQFSMDEYDGFFRIATTEWNNGWTDEGFVSNSSNNLFVLNMDLDVVGRLENLAPGESIYAARFMADRVYLVTFRQIDPFFVIDTADQTAPKVLGYLKIPGFSGYLHSYDENHVIGIGKQDNNVKLSLFDVTNVSAPTEAVDPYIVEADWSDSMVLWDHKAFLFDEPKNLLAIPISLDITIEEPEDFVYYNEYYHGAYVFDISVEQGFILNGNVTHYYNVEPFGDSLPINRILYIENVLYTISDKIVKMNDLESLEPLTEIQLS